MVGSQEDVEDHLKHNTLLKRLPAELRRVNSPCFSLTSWPRVIAADECETVDCRHTAVAIVIVTETTTASLQTLVLLSLRSLRIRNVDLRLMTASIHHALLDLVTASIRHVETAREQALFAGRFPTDSAKPFQNCWTLCSFRALPFFTLLPDSF